MHLGTLYPPAPYDLMTTAKLLNRYHGVLDIERDGAYWRALNIDGAAVLVRVQQRGSDAQPALNVELVAGDKSHAPAALERIRWVLATDVDVSGFSSFARQHAPRLWDVTRPLAGVRHFRSETLFEALATVVIEQQISLAAALKAQRRFAEWGGLSVSAQGMDFYTFPTVERAAAADADALQAELKITRRRVAVIQQAARGITDGTLDIEGLRDVDAGTAYERLLAIKGVGHWTVAWTLLRGLGRYDYVGHNDVALRDAVGYYFHDTDERVSPETVAETFAAFGPHAGLAAFYTLMRWALDRY